MCGVAQRNIQWFLIVKQMRFATTDFSRVNKEQRTVLVRVSELEQPVRIIKRIGNRLSSSVSSDFGATSLLFTVLVLTILPYCIWKVVHKQKDTATVNIKHCKKKTFSPHHHPPRAKKMDALRYDPKEKRLAMAKLPVPKVRNKKLENIYIISKKNIFLIGGGSKRRPGEGKIFRGLRNRPTHYKGAEKNIDMKVSQVFCIHHLHFYKSVTPPRRRPL